MYGKTERAFRVFLERVRYIGVSAGHESTQLATELDFAFRAAEAFDAAAEKRDPPARVPSSPPPFSGFGGLPPEVPAA